MDDLKLYGGSQADIDISYKDYIQKQPHRGVHKKRCSENVQQIYRRTPIPKCDFNKVAKHFY